MDDRAPPANHSPASQAALEHILRAVGAELDAFDTGLRSAECAQSRIGVLVRAGLTLAQEGLPAPRPGRRDRS